MAIILADGHPAIETLREQGTNVIAKSDAQNRTNKLMKVAFVNLMGFTERTDEEIIKTSASAPDDIDLEFEFFSPTEWMNRSIENHQKGESRGKDAYRINNHGTLKELKARIHEFDSAIVSGSALEHNDFVQKSTENPNGLDFYDELVETLDELNEDNTPTLLLCLSAQLDLQERHGIRRGVAENKLLDVFKLQVTNTTSTLTRDLKSSVYMPVGRYGYSFQEDLDKSPDIISLASNDNTGSAYAVSGPFVYLTGHPEYGARAIADEYFRDKDALDKQYAQRLNRLYDIFNGLTQPTERQIKQLAGLENASEAEYLAEMPKIGNPQNYDLNNPTAPWADDGKIIYRNFFIFAREAQKQKQETANEPYFPIPIAAGGMR